MEGHTPRFLGALLTWVEGAWHLLAAVVVVCFVVWVLVSVLHPAKPCPPHAAECWQRVEAESRPDDR